MEERLFSVEDVTKKFKKEPHKLVSYVECGLYDRTGMRRNKAIVSTHIVELSRAVGINLVSQGREYTTLPEMFMSPSNFDNIEAIITAGDRLFPAPLGSRL